MPLYFITVFTCSIYGSFRPEIQYLYLYLYKKNDPVNFSKYRPISLFYLK